MPARDYYNSFNHPPCAGAPAVTTCGYASSFTGGFWYEPVVQPPPPPPPTTQDVTAPDLTLLVAVRANLRSVLRSGLSFKALCTEICVFLGELRLDARMAKRLKLPQVIGRATAQTLAANAQTKIRIKVTAKARRKLARLSSVRLTVRGTATDAAGNAETENKRVTLRR